MSRNADKLRKEVEAGRMSDKLVEELLSVEARADGLVDGLEEGEELAVPRDPELPPEGLYVDAEGTGVVQSTYTPFDKQEAFHQDEARFRTIIAGVRGGKTRSGAYETIKAALEVEDGHGWVVSPTYKLLSVSQDEVMEMLNPHPELIVDKNKAEKWIQFISGTKVEFRSAELPDTLRGRGLDFAWLDEAAFMKESAARIMRTRVSDKLGRLWITTTPKGRNWVHQWFGLGQSGRKGYSSHKWITKDNPHFPPEEWDDAKNDLPADFFAQEYMAEFLDDVAGVFRGVDGIVRKRGTKIEANGPFCLGLDLAKHLDFTVMHVISANGHQIEWRRFNKMPWPDQRQEIKRIANKYDALICMDSTGVGDVIYDDLVADLGTHRVVAIKFSPASKGNMIRLLQTSIEGRDIDIEEEPILIEELKWFEYQMTANGYMRFSAPDGFHDDCVWALALANWGRVHHLTSVTPVMLTVDADEEDDDEEDGEVIFVPKGAIAQRAALLHGTRIRGIGDRFSGLN